MIDIKTKNYTLREHEKAVKNDVRVLKPIFNFKDLGRENEK